MTGGPEEWRGGEWLLTEKNFQNKLALIGPENTQSVGFFNRITALSDVELPVDVLQVSFDGCS